MSDEPPPSTNYGTALSHACVGGTVIYCMYHHEPLLKLGFKCYTILLLNSLMGTWRWGCSECGDGVKNFYDHMSFFRDMVILPFIATELWAISEFSYNVTFAHTLPIIFPWISYIYDGNYTLYAHFSVIVGGITISYVSLKTGNWYGLATVATYWFNIFVIKNLTFEKISSLDLYNLGMCFFAYFSLRAMEF